MSTPLDGLSRRSVPWSSIALLSGLLLLGGPSSGSDHSDAPAVGDTLRQDANLTDLFAFRTKETLVLALCSDPSVAPSVTEYVWPDDVTYEINIDLDAKVDPADPDQLGGTIEEPSKIKEDVTLRIRFRHDGVPDLDVRASHGLKKDFEIVDFFAGLRDDPFIRGPRQGRNVAAIVIALPIEPFLEVKNPLLIWATTSVRGFRGHDLAGRSLRSMFGENAAMNNMEPRQMARKLGAAPDVMIYDLKKPAIFPNGRALTDDVVDLVGDPRVLGNDFPFPSENDLPFLTDFPYLALPHPPH